MNSLTVKQVIENVNVVAGEFVSVALAVKLANEATDILAIQYDTACNVVPMEIEIDDINLKYELPEDVIGIKNVTCNGKRYTNFNTDRNLIKVNTPGTFVIDTLIPPRHVEEETDSLDIHRFYHPAIVNYISSRVVRPPDEDLESSFYSLAISANERLSRLKRRGIRIPARLWR